MKWMNALREKTADMNGREKFDYIVTYYWYHILGVLAAVSFLVFLIIHFGFGNQRPEFTCVLVNQNIDYARDERIRDAFAKEAEREPERIVIDSDYQISYAGAQLAGINESSYEKFFFQWENGEIDAVIVPESFYHYCKELGGTFRDVEELGAAGLPLYKEDGVCRAVLIGQTALAPELDGAAGASDSDAEDALLLAFPVSGAHADVCAEFIGYISQINEK